MPVQITPKPDHRAEQIIRDPDKYYAAARERTRRELERESQRPDRSRGRT